MTKQRCRWHPRYTVPNCWKCYLNNAAPQPLVKSAMIHCWKDKREWVEETYGFHSDEHLLTYQDGQDATCMLEADHNGPHEWTPDDGVEITFPEENDVTNC